MVLLLITVPQDNLVYVQNYFQLVSILDGILPGDSEVEIHSISMSLPRKLSLTQKRLFF